MREVQDIMTRIHDDGDLVLSQLHDDGNRLTQQTFANDLIRDIIFAWRAFGTADLEAADFRACQNYGPLYGKV
jgi:hypothetical protein